MVVVVVVVVVMEEYHQEEWLVVVATATPNRHHVPCPALASHRASIGEKRTGHLLRCRLTRQHQQREALPLVVVVELTTLKQRHSRRPHLPLHLATARSSISSSSNSSILRWRWHHQQSTNNHRRYLIATLQLLTTLTKANLT